MTHTLAWGHDETLPHRQPRVEVSSPADLDAALDRIANSLGDDDLPVVVDLFPTGQERIAPSLQFALAPESGKTASFLLWLDWDDDDATCWAYREDQQPPDKPMTCVYGGQPVEYDPEHLRVTTSTARQAAREYLVSGQRPTSLNWR